MNLSRQVAIVAAGRVAATASVFAVNALLARAWTLDAFGRFSAMWILGNTLVPVFLVGVPAALLHALPRREPGEGGRLLLAQASVVLLASATLLVLLLLGCGGAIAGFAAPGSRAEIDTGALLIPFLPYVFSLVASGHIEAALVASGRPHWQAWLSLAGGVALIAVGAVALTLGASVAQALWALSVAGALRLAGAYGLLAAAAGVPHRWSAAGLGGFLRYAASVGLNDAMGSLSRAVDRVVVLAFLGVADLGIYHVGAIEVPVSLALAAVATVLVPEVSRLSAAGRHDDVAALFRTAVGRLALVVLPLFFFLFAHAGDLIAVYLPAGFDRSDEVFRVFLLALPLRCAVYNPVLVGAGQARWALYGATLDLTLNAALSLWFVRSLQASHPAWALLGPAAASVLATYAQVGVLVAAIAHLLHQPWRTILPWGRLARAAAVGVGAGAVSAGAVHLVAVGAPLRLALGAAVFAVVAGALTVRLPGADHDELRQLVRAVARRERPT